MVRSNQQTTLLTNEVHVVSPRSTQTVTAPSPIPLLPVRVMRARSREAVPTMLYSESSVSMFSCLGCTEINSLSCASILIIVAAVWDGSNGLVDEATNVFISRVLLQLIDLITVSAAILVGRQSGSK